MSHNVDRNAVDAGGFVTPDAVMILTLPLFFYFSSSLIVLFGFYIGATYFKGVEPSGHVFSYHRQVVANWDGQWYMNIADKGYFYEHHSHSNVAFFPAYPLLGQSLSRITGLTIYHSLIVISNLALFCNFHMVYQYALLRADQACRNDVAGYALLAFGLVPVTFFFRAAYSESLFVSVTLLFLIAVQRRWPLIITAGIVGFATVTRPVGIALIPPLLLHAWHCSSDRLHFAKRLAYLLPAACWGIAGYVLFLTWKFGEPMAFSKTQVNWAARPRVLLLEKLVALATLEPMRRIFDPVSPVYWATLEPNNLPMLSLHVADPFYFLSAVVLLAVGAWKRWLNRLELTLGVFLLLIPYVTASYETYGRSLGRYSSVVIPVYFVLGNLLCRCHAPFTAALAGISGFLLGTYSAMFTSWHRYI